MSKTNENEIKEQRIADRRALEIDFKRRQFKRRGKAFVYDREIYLSDTNAYTNVYFANFFHLIGEAREAWLLWLLGEQAPDFFRSGIGMVTADCSMKYKDSLYCFDRVVVNLTVAKLTRTKLTFSFEIFNKRNKKTCAIATMSVGATYNGKIVELPNVLVEAIKRRKLV